MADVIILDGAAIISMLKPIDVKTFQDYAKHIFLPFIKAQLRNVTRIDIIWDVHLEDSLKSTAREIRGGGIRQRVAPSNTIPGNWQEFLRLADNKTELFDFLAHQVVENLSREKDDYTTCGQNVLGSQVGQDISSLAPCTHEEADIRMLLLKHLRYIPAHDIAKELGYEKALSLPMFHAFTGCDTVSSFAGREKKLHLTNGSLSMRSHLYSLP